MFPPSLLSSPPFTTLIILTSVVSAEDFVFLTGPLSSTSTSFETWASFSSSTTAESVTTSAIDLVTTPTPIVRTVTTSDVVSTPSAVVMTTEKNVVFPMVTPKVDDNSSYEFQNSSRKLDIDEEHEVSCGRVTLGYVMSGFIGVGVVLNVGLYVVHCRQTRLTADLIHSLTTLSDSAILVSAFPLALFYILNEFIFTSMRICDVWLSVVRCTSILNTFLLFLLPLSILILRKISSRILFILATSSCFLLLILSLLPLVVTSSLRHHDNFVCEHVTASTLQVIADITLIMLAVACGVAAVCAAFLYRNDGRYSPVKLKELTKTPAVSKSLNAKLSVGKARAFCFVVTANLALKLPFFVVECARRYSILTVSSTGNDIVVVLFVVCGSFVNPFVYLTIQSRYRDTLERSAVIKKTAKDPCVTKTSV